MLSNAVPRTKLFDITSVVDNMIYISTISCLVQSIISAKAVYELAKQKMIDNYQCFPRIRD